MQKEDLIIPIYVDTNALLDLLASIEGGFSVVEKVTTRNTASKDINREVSADTGTEFGIPNVLNLLKLNIGYSANWKKAKEDSKESQTERYHTYGSLFYRLRDYLNQNDLIKNPSYDSNLWEDINASDFVEIHGIFRPNPLADSLNIIDRLLGMFQLMAGFSVGSASQSQNSSKSTNQSSRGSRGNNTTRSTFTSSFDRDQLKQMEQFRKFLAGILGDIQTEKVRAFVTDLIDIPNHKAVSLLFMDYLRDQTMREISHKEYRMLGKVVRKLDQDSNETIDLLTGTGLGGIGRDTLDNLLAAFNTMPGMNLPEIQTEIEGPALEIVPIAVYV
jgi:hypothetical protein